MLVFFIFGIFAYIYIYILSFYAMMMLESIFFFTRFGSYVDVSILACFHMYIHVGMEVGIHTHTHTHTHTHIHTHTYISVYVRARVCVCARARVCMNYVHV